MTDIVHGYGDPENPREADSISKAIFITQLPTGKTVIEGRQDKEEWIHTEDMGPISIEDCR